MNSLVERLDSALALVHGSRRKRLARATLRTLYGFFYSRIVWGVFRRSYEKSARMFFGDYMVTRLPVGLDLYLYGMLADQSEIQLTRYLLERVKPGMVFFDVGASYGFYTLLTARLIGDRGAIHAFEASPTTFNTLKENVKLRPHILANHAACTDHDGIVCFFEFSSGQEGASSMYPYLDEATIPSRGKSPTKVSVTAIALDSYCARRDVLPDVVKIDVEGGERDVVIGMQHVISERSPVIAMEFWHPPRPNTSHKAAVDFLVSRGYQVFAFADDNALVRIADIEHYSPKGTSSENLILLHT